MEFYWPEKLCKGFDGGRFLFQHEDHADLYGRRRTGTLYFWIFICGYAEPGYKGAHRIPGYFTASMALSGSRNC